MNTIYTTRYIISLIISSILTFNPYIFAAAFDKSDPEVERDLPLDYIIGAGDVLEINVYEEPDLCKTVRVSETGMITYPLLGRVAAAGLTVAQTEENLIDLLSKDYLVNPQVNVFIKEYSKFYVYGEVEKVGVYPIYGRLTVLEAITMAGGFSKVAAKGRVRIIRKEADKERVIYVNVGMITKKGRGVNDILIHPNDVIIVPESFF